MSDALLLQQVYTDSAYIRLIDLTRARHAAYCERFDIDHRVHVRGELDGLGGWEKLRMVREYLDKYDLIVWLDADAYIEDLTVDLRRVPNPTDSIGAVWFPVPTPHWNVGVLYFRPGGRVRMFLEGWLERFPGEGRWREQQVFQEMGAVPNSPVFTLPDEWNSSFDHNWKDKRIVSAFHGHPNRLETMTEWLRSSIEGAPAPEA